METTDYQLHQIDAKNHLANYIYVLRCTQTKVTAVIDPTEAPVVLDFLAEKQWPCDMVLNTHHHNDHTDGNEMLKAQTGCVIIGNKHDAERIPYIDTEVEEGGTVSVGNLHADILDIPGHTLGHIAFHFAKQKLLFSGDTLFSMGCGRMFEGTAEQMVRSFAKITSLPDETLICAAHEYSKSNAAFALQYDPDNAALQEREKEVTQLRNADKPTVPVTLISEKKTNPFLRCDDMNIRSNLEMQDATTAEVFARLRHLKDHF